MDRIFACQIIKLKVRGRLGDTASSKRGHIIKYLIMCHISKRHNNSRNSNILKSTYFFIFITEAPGTAARNFNGFSYRFKTFLLHLKSPPPHHLQLPKESLGKLRIIFNMDFERKLSTDDVIVFDEMGKHHGEEWVEDIPTETRILSYNYTLEYAWMYDPRYKSAILQFLRSLHALQKEMAHLRRLSNALPNELALMVMSHCDAKTLVAVSGVSKAWKAISDTPEYWDKLCIRDFAVSVHNFQRGKICSTAEDVPRNEENSGVGEGTNLPLTPKELYKASFTSFKSVIKAIAPLDIRPSSIFTTLSPRIAVR